MIFSYKNQIKKFLYFLYYKTMKLKLFIFFLYLLKIELCFIQVMNKLSKFQISFQDNIIDTCKKKRLFTFAEKKIFNYFINLLYIHTPPITRIASITSPMKIDAIIFIIKEIITIRIIKTIIPMIIFPIILN